MATFSVKDTFTDEPRGWPKRIVGAGEHYLKSPRQFISS